MCLTTEGEAEACSAASWLWLNCVPPACALQGRLILMTRWGSEAPGPNALGSQWDIHFWRWDATFIASHDPPPLQLDSLSVYLVRCLLLQWLEILRQWLDDWQQTREEFSQVERLMQEDLCVVIKDRTNQRLVGEGVMVSGLQRRLCLSEFWNNRYYPCETELCC